MYKYPTLIFLLVVLLSCQSEGTVTAPDFINFDAIENNADEVTSGRKTEALRAKVSVVAFPNEVVVLADELDGDRNNAYILQTPAQADFASTTFERAWVVFLQDHLVVINEQDGQKIRLSIANRPLDSQVINESMTFDQLITGDGLARYNQQPVQVEDLEDVSSYLEARAEL